MMDGGAGGEEGSATITMREFFDWRNRRTNHGAKIPFPPAWTGLGGGQLTTTTIQGADRTRAAVDVSVWVQEECSADCPGGSTEYGVWVDGGVFASCGLT